MDETPQDLDESSKELKQVEVLVGILGAKLEALAEKVDELARRDREMVEKLKALSAKLPNPRPGEVVIFGQTWSKQQIWIVARTAVAATVMASIIVTMASIFVVYTWRLADANRERHASHAAEIALSIVELEEFADQGKRATREDLLKEQDRIAVLTRCMLQRFTGRTEGLRAGTHLKDADAEWARAVETCLTDLERQHEALGKLRLARP